MRMRSEDEIRQRIKKKEELQGKAYGRLGQWPHILVSLFEIPILQAEINALKWALEENG